ncbi:universal stress protein family [Legionella oakridgensis]|nr:universal stress protein family [Legionella oakridgensis]
MEQLDHFLKECNVKYDQFEKKIRGGYLADTNILQSKNWNTDLLAFGAQGNSKLRLFPNYLSLDHIFINSVAIQSPSTRSCKRNHPFQIVDQAAFPVLLESVQPPNLAIAL